MEDYPQVRKVWEQSGLAIRPGDRPGEVKAKLRRDPGLFLVAVDEGMIVGAVIGAWDGRRGWLYHLGVLPKNQREGVASMLVAEVLNRMRKKGVSKVNAVVYRSNARSLAFFGKMGFIPDPESVLHGLVLTPSRLWKNEARTTA